MWTNVVLVKLDINSLGGVLVTLDISSCTIQDGMFERPLLLDSDKLPVINYYILLVSNTIGVK